MGIGGSHYPFRLLTPPERPPFFRAQQSGDRMQQEVVLALLAREPSHDYELRGRLSQALGPLGDVLDAGQVWVTLRRLGRAGTRDLVAEIL